MLEKGLELSANLAENSLVACSCLKVTYKWLWDISAWRRQHTHIYTVLFTTFRVLYAMLRDVGGQFWCFLLADLSVGVHTAARVPFCLLFCRNPQATRGKESLADGWGRARRRLGQPDGTESKKATEDLLQAQEAVEELKSWRSKLKIWSSRMRGKRNKSKILSWALPRF